MAVYCTLSMLLVFCNPRVTMPSFCLTDKYKNSSHDTIITLQSEKVFHGGQQLHFFQKSLI